MPESVRDVAEKAARDEVSRFAREAFDYEWPHETGSTRPRELLEWTAEQKQWHAARRKYLGAGVLAVASALLSAAAPGLWAWLSGFLSR